MLLNAVFHSSPGLIRIWWYPLQRFIFENIWDPLSTSNMSSSGNRELVLHSYLIDGTAIHTHAPSPSFLRYQQNRNIRTHALSNKPLSLTSLQSILAEFHSPSNSFCSEANLKGLPLVLDQSSVEYLAWEAIRLVARLKSKSKII